MTRTFGKPRGEVKGIPYWAVGTMQPRGVLGRTTAVNKGFEPTTDNSLTTLSADKHSKKIWFKCLASIQRRYGATSRHSL
jgi:hypothetical protein